MMYSSTIGRTEGCDNQRKTGGHVYILGCKSPTNQNAPIPRYSLRYFFGLGFVMKEKKEKKKATNGTAETWEKKHG